MRTLGEKQPSEERGQAILNTEIGSDAYQPPTLAVARRPALLLTPLRMIHASKFQDDSTNLAMHTHARLDAHASKKVILQIPAVDPMFNLRYPQAFKAAVGHRSHYLYAFRTNGKC